MACAEHEPSLQALLFGELESTEKEAIEHHLEVCARCRRAYEEARVGLEALSSLREAPLPYAEDETRARSQPDAAWLDFRERLRIQEAIAHRRESPRGWLAARGVAAAAAILLVGFALGRSVGVERLEPVAETVAEVRDPDALAALRVESGAVEALARAQLLADVGLRYVTGVQDLYDEVSRMSSEPTARSEVAVTRERARELIRDGRLLRRNLDPEVDRVFLAAMGRAEIFLEELAVLEPDATGTSARLVQSAWSGNELWESLSAVEVEEKLARAIEASGWIGQELVDRKELGS
jgi:hypothetical protein